MPPPGEIVFSFANRAPQPDQPDRISLTQRKAAQLGEPWLTTAQPDTLEPELRAVGFSDILFLTPSMILSLYLQNRPDHLPVPRKSSIVSARI
jgi:hypothetical protein